METLKLTLQIPEKLVPLTQKHKRFKILYGGRGSAKSTTIADLCLVDSLQKGMKIGCLREFYNSLDDSCYSLLQKEIKRLGLPGYTPLASRITNENGGELRFRGLARNPDSITSMDGFHRFWIEQAETISTESLRLLVPTLREPNSEFWMSANPQSSADPFSQRFIEPYKKILDRDGYYEDDLHLIIRINYMDNPWFPATLEADRAFDEKHLPPTEYAHIWLGEYNDSVPGSIIQVAWFNAAVGAAEVLGIKPQGAVIASHDPSDLGPDSKGLVFRHGSLVTDVLEKDDGDANEGCDWSTEIAIQRKADVFRWDGDGMGALLRRQVASAFNGKRVSIEMFKGSEGVDDPGQIYQPDPNFEKSQCRTNEQTFRNKRAQYYFALRDRFHHTYEAVVNGIYHDPATLICLNPDMPLLQRLRSEVCRIPQKKNANGLLQIATKEEMRRMKPPIASPNLADALMMSMPAPIQQAKQYRAKPVVTRSMAGWV